MENAIEWQSDCCDHDDLLGKFDHDLTGIMVYLVYFREIIPQKKSRTIQVSDIL